MIYVSIDLETTGTDPYNCQILEIGAVAQELGGEELDTFYRIIKYDTLTGSPFALNMNSRLIQAIIDGAGVSLHRALDDFLDWLEPFGVDEKGVSTPLKYDKRVVAAGKNFAGFDRPFLEINDRRFSKAFFRRVIDPGTLYIRPGEDILPPSTKTCMERAGIAGEVTHNALEDAIVVRDLIENHFRS